MSKKILIAIDDSENAMRAVDYVGKTFNKDIEITLFSVLIDSSAICDMNSPELTPYFTSQQVVFCSLEDKKKELITKAQSNAKKRLINEGFDESRINTKAEIKKKGVARDIIHEAQKGYDTIVMGRRGLSGLTELFIGSISQKVTHAVKDISVILVN